MTNALSLHAAYHDATHGCLARESTAESLGDGVLHCQADALASTEAAAQTDAATAVRWISELAHRCGVSLRAGERLSINVFVPETAIPLGAACIADVEDDESAAELVDWLTNHVMPMRYARISTQEWALPSALLSVISVKNDGICMSVELTLLAHDAMAQEAADRTVSILAAIITALPGFEQATITPLYVG